MLDLTQPSDLRMLLVLMTNSNICPRADGTEERERPKNYHLPTNHPIRSPSLLFLPFRSFRGLQHAAGAVISPPVVEDAPLRLAPFLGINHQMSPWLRMGIASKVVSLAARRVSVQ